MLIKKYTKQTDTSTSLVHRLTAYSSQAKQYRRNPALTHSSHSLPDWKKTTLAALIPLAAASVAQAQCQGGLASTVLGPNQTFQIDVDGDLVNDIQIRGGALSSFGSGLTAWFVTAINPLFYIGLTSQNRARGASDGSSITRGQAFGTGQRVLCQSFGFGQFCLSYTDRSIPVRKGDAVTGQPGWVRISIGAMFGVGGNNFTVTERGVESLTNASLNSAVVNDCTSIQDDILPVELTRFDAKPQGKHITLTWATATELNNSGFEVQRSTDGKSFSKIGWVKGIGTTLLEQEYAFIDNEVRPNTLYYYRLRQLDHDGTENFTPLRSAIIKDGSRLKVEQIFPNPVSRNQESANFQVSSPQEGQLDVQLFDARGTVVKQLNQSIGIGATIFSVAVGDLAAGMYFVKMQLDKEVSYQRLIVE